MPTTYIVTDRWPFPADMLCYDEAHPATAHDATLIETFSNPSESPYPPGSKGEREVSITLVSNRSIFFLRSSCSQRWRFYGWRSSLDDSLQPPPAAQASGRMASRGLQPSSCGRFQVVEDDGTTGGRLLADDLDPQAAVELAAVPPLWRKEISWTDFPEGNRSLYELGAMEFDGGACTSIAAVLRSEQ